MFALSSSNRFHLYLHPTDMRKSFDGLSGLVTEFLNSKPLSGDVFIFVNRRRDKLSYCNGKVLVFHCTINGWQESVSNLLRPLYENLKHRILSQGYLQVDETPIQIGT